jgi:hypothetical protein
MAPTQITISDDNCGGDDHIWRVRYDDGTVLDQPSPGGFEYTTILPDSGTYEIQVDVNDKNSKTTSFSVDNYPLNSAAISFFDENGNIWTAVLEDPCTLPVLADQFNTQPCGGIDIVKANNRLCYVGEGDIRLRFPNGRGELLSGVDNASLSLIDIEIDNVLGDIYLAINRGGQLFIAKTTGAQLADDFQEGFFSDEYSTYNNIEQIAFGKSGNMVYFTNSTFAVFFQKTEISSYPEDFSFNINEPKTALAYHSKTDILYFAAGDEECTIFAVNPDNKEILREYPITCNGRINSMDLDEENNILYYSDDANIWKLNLDGNSSPMSLIFNLAATLDSKGNPGPAIKLPIHDIVFAQYDQ